MTGRNNTDRPFYPLCPARLYSPLYRPVHATTLPTKPSYRHVSTFKPESFQTFPKFRNQNFTNGVNIIIFNQLINFYKRHNIILFSEMLHTNGYH